MSDLQGSVNHIAQTISEWDWDELNEDGEPVSVYDWLQDALDIEYTVSSDRQYLGARILVTFGGPNIWVNTRTETVEGYWWADKAFASFTDSMGLNETLEELYECQ